MHAPAHGLHDVLEDCRTQLATQARLFRTTTGELTLLAHQPHWSRDLADQALRHLQACGEIAAFAPLVTPAADAWLVTFAAAPPAPAGAHQGRDACPAAAP